MRYASLKTQYNQIIANMLKLNVIKTFSWRLDTADLNEIRMNNSSDTRFDGCHGVENGPDVLHQFLVTHVQLRQHVPALLMFLMPFNNHRSDFY